MAKIDGKVGLMGLRPPSSDWEVTKEIATRADQLGFSSLTMGEAWGEDAFTSLAQLATVTDRISIGTSIVPVYARTPANLAMTALNMDIMSKGRFFLGLGSSGKLVIEDFHGEKFEKPLSRMREYINFIRMALRGDRLDLEGEFFSTKRFRLRFTPYRETLPIFVASLTPLSLQMTGEIADGWLPIYYSPGRMAPSYDKLKSGAEITGRSLSDITVSPQVSIYVTKDKKEAFNRERPHIAFYIGGMGTFYHEYMHRIGFGDESDAIREKYLNQDRIGAAEIVTNEMVAATSLIGSADECVEQMQRYYDDGVDEIRLVFNEPDAAGYHNIIESIGKFI
jgi:F420-dependent oxidoreductase-like protein